MNLGRGSPTPRNGNGDSWIPPGVPTPHENGIGQSRGSWTTTMNGGSVSQESAINSGADSWAGTTPRQMIPVDDGIVCGQESWTTANPERANPMGVVGSRGSWTTTTERAVPQGIGIARNNNYPTFPQLNGTVTSRNSWTPITPDKTISQRSNTIPVDKQESQLGNENWQDLIGMYTDLLQEEKLDPNGLVLNFNHTPKPPTSQGNGNPNWLASTPNRNANPIPCPYPNHSGNQDPASLSYLPKNNSRNWNDNCLESMVGSKRGSTCVSSANVAQNNRAHVLGRPIIHNPSTQVESSWVKSTSGSSMLGSQQTHTITSNKLINHGYNMNQLPMEGFPIPYRPCYNLNATPRSEPDAASSSITGLLPSDSVIPDTRGKYGDKNQWVPEKVSFSVEEITTPAKDRHENQTLSIRSEDAENLYNELLHTIGGSPSSAISTTQREHIVPEEGDEQGVDVNKTPQQKTPARKKKHRPKVIREGKPKRTPKPKDPGNSTSAETRVKRKYVRKNITNISRSQQGNGVAEKTPVVKRKYVRKKGINNSESQQKSRVDDVAAPVAETPANSCKKQLNFDSECVAGGGSQDIRDGQQGINLNVNPQDIEQERRMNSLLKTSAMKIAQQNNYVGATSNEESSSTKRTQAGNQYTSLPENVLNRGHALNLLARNLSMRRNSMSRQDSWRDGYNQVNQHVHREGIGNIVFQGHMVPTNLERARQPILQGTPQPFASGGVLNLNERRGIKRQSSEQMQLHNMNAMNSLLVYQKLLLGIEPDNGDGNSLAGVFSENHKKMKMLREFQSLVSTEPSNVRPEARQMNDIYGNNLAGRVNPAYKLMNISGNVDSHHFRRPMVATQNLQMHQVSSGVQRHTTRSIAKRHTWGHGIRPVTGMVGWNPPPLTPPKGTSRAISTYQQSTTPVKGRVRKQKYEVLVDDITNKLEGLCIYDENEKEKNALVPYRSSNAVVLFEPIKKRKPRPKVDLDPETDRLWKLLMGKEGSGSAETLDKDKEKWWENERRVFFGRADSFIARMHVVQGDRRFSRWKGSVVDSVIGVFLTQNVSDHLSSSAFMSLAAKFPVKSTNETHCQGRACMLNEEPIVVEPSDIIECHENIIRQPVLNKISEEKVILSQDSFDYSTVQTVDEIRSSSGSNSEAEDQTTGFETSKQFCPSVGIVQAEKPSMFKENFSCEKLSTLLDEQGTNMHHLTKDPKCNMQIPRTSGVNSLNSSSRFKETLASSSHFRMNVIPGLQKVGSLNSRMLGGESASSMPSPSVMTEARHMSNVAYQQNEMPTFQASSLGQYNYLSSHPTQHIDNNHQRLREVFSEMTGHAETPGKGKTGSQKGSSITFGGTENNVEDRTSVVDKQNCLENTVAEANSKEQNSTSQKPNGASTNMSKSRKGTTEVEKNEAFDWDSLRKQVLSSGENKQRSKDATDSLDYDALRHAHVNEISDTIRERGMNNLLADRIKGFLNRLVKDHGSIDLEWLRDAPPDKAKDYLLSIRGLGLKSVECVRLLTLHHLAFPVDTNVGRIAVRLGWVPLQPLPESLQLHLLEMYPVLESIQKYLWPRLCKLDQLTLYELHYQMITFGKVFCTKSKPNCNACPMKLECRHFASAYASARLALPGPEEKRIVTSDAPIATDPAPPVVNRPMPLPPAENNYNTSGRFFGRECEPIIEEPTTPEPETNELSISDIEDQYYEDSDDILSIKLNMEEFTTNLQNVMQDSKGLQGDMSRALVALNPEAASIPTAKLKNVSRLRTEHEVYELPDSHPLLKGFDKREPDDPSPYLLAIWTPGETANSVQPPERGCPAQESGQLCNQTTCFSCNSIREANSQVVRGTILVPCRTAMRGSFPLNGTYFQVNEMFADHASSLDPIAVPRAWIWSLPRRTVYFGTSVSTIFKGLNTEGIRKCFWTGFVCVRGFDQKTRAPRPLMARLHFPASKMVKTKNEGK